MECSDIARGAGAFGLLAALSCSGPGGPGHDFQPTAEAADIGTLLVSVQEALAEPETTSSLRRSRLVVYPPTGAPLEAESTTWRRDDGTRLELQFADGHSLVMVKRGERAQEWVDGRPTLRDARAEFAQRRELEELIDDLVAQTPTSPRLLGLDEIEGAGPQLVIEQDRPSARWRLWVDAETRRPRRVLRSSEDSAGRAVIEQVFLDDYAETPLGWLPQHRVTLRNGQKVSESWLLEASAPTDAEAGAWADGLFDVDKLYKQ